MLRVSVRGSPEDPRVAERGQTPSRAASAPHRLLCPSHTDEDKEPPPAHGVRGASRLIRRIPSPLSGRPPGPAHHVAARSPARSASNSLAARLRPHTSRVGPSRTSQTPEPDLRRAGGVLWLRPGRGRDAPIRPTGDCAGTTGRGGTGEVESHALGVGRGAWVWGKRGGER